MTETPIQELKRMLKGAMQVELGTIPLYMYAYYSVDATTGSPDPAVKAGAQFRVALLGIAMQEMLHLALAGNVLRATGEIPKIYDKDFVPTYPSTILKTKIEMNLRPGDKENLSCFLKIEAPYWPPPLMQFGLAKELLPDTESIGYHYKHIRELIEQIDNPFQNGNVPYQYDSNEFFGSGMYIVGTKEDAYKALDLITEQGEGGLSVPDSHYTVFVDFFQQKEAWNLLPLTINPTPATYPPGGLLKHLSDAFDASYCYLLATIEQVWQTSRDTDAAARDKMIRKLRPLMSNITTPLANIMIQQPFGDRRGGPCFAYYSNKPDQSPNTIDELYTAIRAELALAKPLATPPVQQLIDRVDYALQLLHTA